MSQPNIKTTIDVRFIIPCAKRHAIIFETFEALQPGEMFQLVNDHDPRPLYYQFESERTGQFIWEYVKRGPDTWQVYIGKPA